jgi:hypothetical protein
MLMVLCVHAFLDVGKVHMYVYHIYNSSEQKMLDIKNKT